MSLRLTKPGIDAVAALPVHPFTGLTALGVLPSGKVVWPVMGGSEDEDDPDFTGSGGGGREDEDEDDEEDEEDEDEDPKKKTSKSKRGKHSKDDDEEDEDEDDKPTRPERQAARYRTQLRAEQARTKALEARLKAIEDKDKKPEELSSRDLTEAREKADKADAALRELRLQNAFLRASVIDWVDPADALRLLDLDDVEIDEDGTVDARSLRTALRDLAKRKPHLVKVEKDKDQDDEDTDSRSGPRMNGKRRGQPKTATRAELAKRFPVLNQNR